MFDWLWSDVGQCFAVTGGYRPRPVYLQKRSSPQGQQMRRGLADNDIEVQDEIASDVCIVVSRGALDCDFRADVPSQRSISVCTNRARNHLTH